MPHPKPIPPKERNTTSTTPALPQASQGTLLHTPQCSHAQLKGQRIGYIRVSTFDQNTGRQLEGIILDRVFTDHASGKSTDRPQLQALLSFARMGDTIVVHSMDRLARNLDDLRSLVDNLTKQGIYVEFIKEHLIFTCEDSALAKLMLSITGSFAEFERSLMKERQREGIALAKKQGKYKGRKRSLSPEQVIELCERIQKKEKKAGLAREFEVSRETLYQYWRAWEKTHKQENAP